MTAAGLLTYLFAGAVIAIALGALRETARQTRGTFGRAYWKILADVVDEGARRTQLLARIVDMREARISRLERRAEGQR
jgi:hypothetical protein